MSAYRLLLSLLLALAACSPRADGGPTRSVYTGQQRTAYYFEGSAGSWQTFSLDNDAALFRLNEGGLEGAVVANRGYVWSLNNETHEDVIVNARVRQMSGSPGSAFGVVCRADESGNGYYFLLASSGEFAISVATDDRSDPFQLVPWQRHSAVRQGFVENEIRAVCVEDYLAMFVNDVFVAETTDEEFKQGQLGVTVGAVERTAWVRFDDILIRDAIMVGRR